MIRAPFIEPDSANGFRFAWNSAYLNYTWFSYRAPDGSAGKLQFRRGLSDYEASIYNGGADAYRRDCGPLVGVLVSDDGIDRPVSPELVAAFNAWQIIRHNASLGFMRQYPERYGDPADWPADMLAPPPLAIDGACYVNGAWRFNLAEAA